MLFTTPYFRSYFDGFYDTKKCESVCHCISFHGFGKERSKIFACFIVVVLFVQINEVA